MKRNGAGQVEALAILDEVEAILVEHGNWAEINMAQIPSAQHLIDSHPVRETNEWHEKINEYVAERINNLARALVRGNTVTIEVPNFRHTDWRKNIWVDYLPTLKERLVEEGYTVYDYRGYPEGLHISINVSLLKQAKSGG